MFRKNWTVLIYADGNNDLEPEMIQSFLDMESVGSGPKVSVLVQLARAPQKKVQILRPNMLWSTNNVETWSGVRRYLLIDEPIKQQANRILHSHLEIDLGNVNMAAPTTLKDFIVWGIKKCPAEHYLLILAGHGAGFMGALSEYTFNCPQVMSITGISWAITAASRLTKQNIDILLFDSCYLNMAEIIYELGSNSYSPKYIIAPSATPLKGLPYRNILQILRNNYFQKPAQLLKILTAELNVLMPEYKITPIKINKFYLSCLKSSVNLLAKAILKKNPAIVDTLCNPAESFSAVNINELCTALTANSKSITTALSAFLVKRCLCKLTAFDDCAALNLYCPERDEYFKMHTYYRRLRFTDNNYWLNILADCDKQMPLLNKEAALKPIYLPLEGAAHVIKTQNPTLTGNDIQRIIRQMGWINCPRLKQ